MPGREEAAYLRALEASQLFSTPPSAATYLLPFTPLWGNWSSENWYSKILLLWPLLLLLASQTQIGRAHV